MTQRPSASSPREPPPAFASRLFGADGIRGVVCLLIIWYHIYIYSSPSGPPTRDWPFTLVVTQWQLGVPMFFLLSAFLLYRPFVQSILRGRDRPAFGAYLANRALRILPAYWVILGATALAGATVVWVPRHEWGFHLPTFLANAFFVHGLHPSGIQTGIPPAWTLAVEWCFYLLLPGLVLLALAAGGRAATRRRRVLATLLPPALLFLIGLAGHELGRRTFVANDPAGVLNTWHAVVERSFPVSADAFAVGMFVAVLRVQFEDGRLRLPPWWRRAAFAVWVVSAWAIVLAHDAERIERHLYVTLMGLTLGLFVCIVVLWDGDPRRDPLVRVLQWRPFTWLGDVSLSAYLIHYPIIVLIIDHTSWFRSGYAGMLFNAVLVTAIVLCLAYLSHRFVEIPGMRRKYRTKTAGPAPPLESEAELAAPEPARA